MLSSPDRTELKKMAVEQVDQHADEIVEIGRTIWRNPELGYKEKKTAALMGDVFDRYGIPHRDGIALTGVKGVLKGRSHEGTIGVAGDMDCVVCPDHPDADLETGGAHSCGHHGQVTALLATAIALASSGVMEHLDGDVQFIGMPAEEYVELDFRKRLVDKGLVDFIGGKASWIALGELDDLDLYLASHSGRLDGRLVGIQRGSTNGFIGKMIRFKGQDAHAGAAPHLGVNALQAAIVGLVALNAQRDTFTEADLIRIHPIITKGGDLVNVVPADVRIETYVRGKTLDAIWSADEKLERSMRAGAMALGAGVEIGTMPGYLPQRPELAVPVVTDLLEENAVALFGETGVKRGDPSEYGTASSDFGDVSHIIPAARITTTGVVGAGHSKDFRVTDEHAAYVAPAKVFVATIVDLLHDGAGLLKQAKASYKPVFTAQGYVNMWKEAMGRAARTG
ncbi:MAG: amidohydrolase [Bacillota bacterium]|nr:amidohydrolase [Bacillota bacterium]